MRQSLLGIIYEDDMPELPSDILLLGETEWLRNAPETYGDDAGEVWAWDIIMRLVSQSLTQLDMDDIRAYCPQMLKALRFHYHQDHIAESMKQQLLELLAKDSFDFWSEL